MKMSTNKDAKLDLSLEEALNKDIDSFPGTKAELSVRVLSSKQGLYQKQRHFRGSYFSLPEIVDILLTTESRHTMHAVAKILGGVYLDLPACNVVYPQDKETLMQKMSQIHIRMGRLFDCVDEACEDNVIDEHEKLSIEALEQEVRTASQEWLQLLYLMHPDKGQENETDPAA